MGELTFFFDRNFGVRLPQAIMRLRPEFNVQYHQQHYKDYVPDDEWLSDLAGKGWIVLSHDIKFHSEATESLAVQQHELGCFYLPCQQSPLWYKAEIFFKAHRKMIELAIREKPPYIFNVHRSGRITKVKLK